MEEETAVQSYKVYRRRYAILFTVLLLNISNAALWINYAPVASTVAEYYDVPTAKVNWFSLVYLIVSFPFCFVSTFVIDKYGLKVGIHLGSGLNLVGAIIRALGTSGLTDDPSAQYAISLTGQVFCAMAQSFLLFIATKVSQVWFPENHRAVSTTVLAMSNPLGIVVAEAATPFIIQSSGDIPLNNYVWAGLAILAEVATVVSVTRTKPKTAPSRSAEVGTSARPSYLHQLKDTFTCLPFILLFFSLGTGIGCFNAIATLTQQILCTLGYSDVAGGAANALMILMGFAGSAVTGVLTDKTKMFTEITKICFGLAAFFAIFMLEFYLVPHHLAAILVFCGIFGFFGIGAYPIGLELAVEATYPVEETISTAFIFFSGQLHGIIIIALVPILATEQGASTAYLNICGKTDAAKDYTVPLLIMMCYITAVILVMILFLKTRYKRLEAEIHRKSVQNIRSHEKLDNAVGGMETSGSDEHKVYF